MSRALNYVEIALAKTSRVISTIAMVVIVVMMLFTTTDVILRYFFNRPIRGSMELTQLMLLLAVFLGIAYIQYRKGHISVSVLTDRFPRKVQDILSIVAYVFSLGIIGFMTWAAFDHLKYIWDIARTTLILKVPVAPFQFALFFGYLMLFLVLLLDFVNSVLKVVRR